MDIDPSDKKEVPILSEINDLFNGFCQLIVDNKKWMDEKLKEKNMIGKNKFKIPYLQPLPEETSVNVHNGRPKRKALLEASEKIREDSLCTIHTKLRRVGDTNEVFKKPNKKLELISSLNQNPNVLQNISNITKGKKGKKSTKILNSTLIQGKEVIPDFPNISIVESIEEEKEKSQINEEIVDLTESVDESAEVICKTPQKSPILKKQTKKSSKELFNPYIVNSVKKRVEAFEVLQDNGVTIPSPEPSKMPMRITRTKTKQLQEEQSKKETTKKIISTKVKKHSKSFHNKQNRNSIKGKQQTNIFSPNNDKKISQAEQDKIEKAIQKRNERLNLIKDDLKKKNNEKMIKALNIREAHEKEKQNKIRENEEKVMLQQEQKKKILEQKRRVVEQEKKQLELKKIQQNLKKQKDIKKNNQDQEELKVLEDNNIIPTPSEKKLISNNAEDLRIKLLQSEINRPQPAAINNATFVQTQNPNTSYKLTPIKKKQNNEHTLQEEEEVELDEDDDEEDEEIDEAEKKFISKHTGNHKQVPIWAQYKIRNQNMLQQAVIVTNLFGTKDLKNISKIFPGKKITRRSSAIWNTPVTEN